MSEPYKRTEYCKGAWEIAEWAIPLHTHPESSEGWDIAGFSEDFTPTPDNVRGYIAQAIHKYHKDFAQSRITELEGELAKARGEVERVTASYIEVARDLRSAVSDRNNLRSVVCEMLATTQKRGLDAPEDYMEILRRLDALAEYKTSPQYINLVDNAAAPTEGQDNKV